MVFICVFTPCGELCFTVLEENIASIFSMSELVQVAAEVVWLQKIVGFSTLSLHHPPGPVQSTEDGGSEMSDPIKHKNPKDSRYLKSNFCGNLITWVCDSEAILECDAVLVGR
jgi:hypothetical protein